MVWYFFLGKTEEARADLARLAIIRKQREDAAKKRDEEKKGDLNFDFIIFFFISKCMKGSKSLGKKEEIVRLLQSRKLNCFAKQDTK